MEYNSAIVLAAGRGKRMQSSIPKQYLSLCGRPVAAWSLEAFEHFDPVSNIILVTSAGEIDYCREEIVKKYGISKVSRIVAGGAERYLSVACGLKALEGSGTDYVFIHDGARPLIDDALLSRVLACVRECGACVAGMPVKDTIKVVDGEGYAKTTPDRRTLWQVQTPQVFRYSLVREAYGRLMEKGISSVTDDAMVVETMTDTRVRLVEGSYRNLKITTPEDLEAAEIFLKKNRGMYAIFVLKDKRSNVMLYII